jgi:hypothetical protein
MKKKHLLFSLAIVAASSAWLFTACMKSNSAEVPQGQQSISLYMNDGPGLYDHVFLDIKSVEVLVDTSKNTRKHDGCDWDDIGTRNRKPDSTSLIWESLNVKAGSYDLLGLRNGVDTVLGTGNVHIGSIRLIKVDLGANNYFVKDSVKYPINIPTNEHPYLLIKLMGDEWEHYATGSYRLWIDFDVQRSIVQLRDYKFYLYPYIKAYVVAKTGTIYGTILPTAALPEIVTVYNSSDTEYALPDKHGMFKIRGLKDGTYSVFVNPSNNYVDTTINNITITNSSTASIGTVTLRHK